MIPKNSRIPYSYTSFTDEDKEFNGFINKDKIDTIDFIELYDTESIEFIKNEFNKFKRKFEYDRNPERCYFFKEFCCITGYKPKIYNRFLLSDWKNSDMEDGIDSRVLTCETYFKNDNKYNVCLSFKIKVEHAYQIIIDLEKYINNLYRYNHEKITVEQYNLYVLPIYVYNANKGYIRISDIGYNIFKSDAATILKLLENIRNSLILFTACNHYMVESAIAKGEITKRVYDCNTKRNSTVKTIYNKANSHKEIKFKIFDENNYNPVIRIGVGNNTYSKNSNRVRNICQYRIQVTGHVSHRWVGTGKDKHLEEVFIQPYFRNKDKPFRSVKKVVL